MKEIWKDIEGYEGYYKISDLGRVLGVKRNKILKPSLTINKEGYKQLIIGLCANGKKKSYQLARLVYKSFMNKNIKGMISFKDGDLTNCSITNISVSFKTDRFDLMQSIQVLDTNTGIIYNSMSDLARKINRTPKAVETGLRKKYPIYKQYKIIS